MITIHLVSGLLKCGRCYVRDFHATDAIGHEFKVQDKMGVRLGGIYVRLAPFRYADIYVVRQRCFYRTLIILIHEILHAAVWIFALPKSWDDFIDQRVVER